MDNEDSDLTADAQADQSLHLVFMSEGTFSHVRTNIFIGHCNMKINESSTG